MKDIVMYDLDPSAFYLSQNHPNPFKDKTIIKYCVAYETRVKLIVFNSEGEMIATLVDEEKKAGTYEVEFDSCELMKGTYCFILEAGEYRIEKKMLLIKPVV